MSNFDTAVLTVLKHEGHFVNDSQDPGGATNHGISLRFLKNLGYMCDGYLVGDLDHDGDIDVNDIKKITREDAIKIYRTYFWDKFSYDKVNNQSVATKIFDACVNMGSKHAHQCLQRAIRSASEIELIEDGVIGQKTLDAINNTDPGILLAAYRSELAGFYRLLKNSHYLNGWLNRAYS